MAGNGPKPKWRISSFDRGEERIIAEISTTKMSEHSVLPALKMLYAKRALDYQEIISHHINRNAKEFRKVIHDHRFQESGRISFHVGGDSIYFHAIEVYPDDPNFIVENWEISTAPQS